MKTKEVIVSGVGLLAVFLNTFVSASDLLVAERFVDSFYSYDQNRLAEMMDAGEEGERVLYYQAWADAANYEIQKRRPCTSKETALVCQITVIDDFGETLGYMATDTFSLVVENQKVTGVQFEGDDPPIFMKLFEWISINRAEIMSGPCLNMFAGGHAPKDCARAVVSAARDFVLERESEGESSLPK